MKLHNPRNKVVIGLVFLLLTSTLSAKMPYDEVYVQNHRCLVVRPQNLPPSAPLVVILHGFGSNGEILYELFCGQLNIPPCLFVLPDAPLEIPRLSPVQHAWYDRFTHSYRDMENSRIYLFEVIDRFSNENYDNSDTDGSAHPRPVIIMGESQGGIMSFEAGLNYKGNIAAVVSICGYIPYPRKTLADPLAPKKTPILMVNGEWDPVVQEEDAHATIHALRRAGYNPILREFQTGHKITREMVMEISNFLQKVIHDNLEFEQ